MLKDDPDAGLGQTGRRLPRRLANLRVVTRSLKAGEGTVGALIDDPTVYENLVQFLEGAQRSFLLRSLVRSTIQPDHRARRAAASESEKK